MTSCSGSRWRPRWATLVLHGLNSTTSQAGWLSYSAIADPAAPLMAEPGQPAAWKKLNQSWESCFPDDLSRIRQHAQWLAGLAPSERPTRLRD